MPLAPALLDLTWRTRSDTLTAMPCFFSPAKKPRTVWLAQAGGVGHLSDGGALRPAEQRQDLLLLGARARLARADGAISRCGLGEEAAHSSNGVGQVGATASLVVQGPDNPLGGIA